MNDSEALRVLIAFGTAKQWRALFVKGKFRAVRRRLYKAYIVSEAWKKKWKAALERAGQICELCGNPAVQAHHKTYVRLGDEADDELESVCIDCHKKVHRKLNAKLKEQT